MEYVPDRVVYEAARLERVDLSEARIGDIVWQDFKFLHLRFDRSNLRESVFRSGVMDGVSFRAADLRDSHWGFADGAGPDIINADFTRADLRGSTFAHPLFRSCVFSSTNLKSIDFFGARFEDCIFEGVLDDVEFHGRPYGPELLSLTNPMRNVDFSKAVLKWVEFDRGIDLTSCKFPPHGYVRINHPRATFVRARDRVRAEWTGKDREAGMFILEDLVKHHPEEQPFTIWRPDDLVDSPIGPNLARKLIDIVLQESPRQS